MSEWGKPRAELAGERAKEHEGVCGDRGRHEAGAPSLNMKLDQWGWDGSLAGGAGGSVQLCCVYTAHSTQDTADERTSCNV